MEDTNWFHDLTTDEVKEERLTLAQRLIAFLGALCLIVLTLIAATWPNEARAEEIPVHVYEDQGVSMRLMPRACDDPRVLMMTMAAGTEYQSRWKAIESVWRMQSGEQKPFNGCWLVLSKEEAGAPDDVLVLLFEDGDRFVVLKSEFLKKPGSGA